MQQVNVPFEIVVADDCSPDGTRDIVDEYDAKYPGIIRRLYPAENVGMWENSYRLLNSVKGKYYTFIEGDDYWTDPNKLQQQYDFLEANPDHVCCFHNATVIREEGTQNQLTFSRYPEKPVPETTGLADLLMNGNYVPSSSIMMRNVFNGKLPKLIADEKVMCDTMNHFMHATYGKYHYINKDMSVYRLHAGGVTNELKKIKRLESLVYMIERSNEFSEHKYHTIHQQALQKWYYWLLKVCIKHGDKLRVKKYLKLIKQNREYDDQYHPNFARKVWVQVFMPGGKTLLKFLGK